MSERRWPDKFGSVFAGLGIGLIVGSAALAISGVEFVEKVPFLTYGLLILLAGILIKEYRLKGAKHEH